MKPWQFALLGLGLLATAGCRTDPAVTLLERDNFRKEQEIWRLRGCLEDLQDQLESCQQRDGASRSNGPELERAPRYRGGGAAPSAPPTPDVNQPNVELPSQPSREVPEEFKLPARRLPPETGEPPRRLPGPAEPGGPSLDGPGREEDRHPSPDRNTAAPAGSAAVVPFDPSGDSRQVASITLERRLTGGISTGDGEGDQGLLVVVEPRDAAGRTVDAPADVSVVVYDPAVQEASGHAAMVARWDFTAAETAALFRRDGSEQAIHLAGGWPAELPKHSQLHLFVRYVTADGRRLEADGPVEVALGSGRPARPNHAEARRDAPPPPRRPEWSPERS